MTLNNKFKGQQPKLDMDEERNDELVSFLDQSLKLNTAESAAPVVKVIEATKSMRSLELRGNTLGIEAGSEIARSLEAHPELERCLWSDLFTGRLKNEIPPILEALGKAMIKAGARIRELDLSDNAFGPIGADALKEFLESPSAYSLEVLKLNNNGLGVGGKQIAKSLAECLRKSVAVGGESRLRLKTFIAGRNRLENPGAHALAATFKSLETVEWFDVRQNGIHEEGIRALVSALKHNRNLRHLWLEDNTVLPKGAKALAKTLESWPKLEVLNLSDCLIRDAGCNYILDHLNPQLHRHLKNVYLCGNEMTPPVAKLLIQKWSKFDGFSPRPILHIHTNSFGDEFGEVAAMAPDNVNVGEEEDDLGSLDGDQEEYMSKSSDSDDADVEELTEEEGAEDASMEEDALNTSYDTVITRSTQPDTTPDQMLDELVNKGFGCIKISEDSASTTNGLVSFLDQSLKLNTAESAAPVVKVIEATKCMRSLELRGNTLGIEAGSKIAKSLEAHPELERCLWSDLFTGRLKNEIPPILEALGKAMIKAGARIRELDLSDNAFGPIGADALKEFLESPSAYSLEVLKLNNNGLGVGGKQIAKSLAECLRKSVAVGGESRLRLKTFIAGRNRLENPGAHALAATFKSLETVEWFDVRQNGIHEEGVRALVSALKHNRNLRHLWLEDNTVLPKGAKALAKTLESWPKLEVLNLSDCLIRDAGCNYILDHLNPQLHRHLKNVYLCGNEMTPPVAKLLIQKWSKFDGFSPKPILHIHTNSFGDEFGEVAAMAPDNVNVGEEEDDLGSLDGDQEEYMSKSSDSDDADVDEMTEDDVEEDEIQIISGGVTAEELKRSIDRIDQLDIDFESRFQEDTARCILQLSAPLKSCGMSGKAMERAVEVAENIVKRVEAVRRNPIPATTQLINNIVAQCTGTGVKAEVDWGYHADPQIIGKLLTEMLARGHFQLERTMIQKFFPSK